MLRHDDARLIYLSHPRTASVATEKALRSVGWNWVGQVSRHCRIYNSDWWCYLTPQQRQQWTVLTTVRNPFDALVTWWFKKPLGHDRLCPAWVNEIVAKEGAYFVDGRLWKLHGHAADHVFHFEELPGCLDWLATRGAEVPGLPRENVTGKREGRPYQAFYDRRARAHVRETFAADFEEYGYRWEPLEESEAA